MNTPVQYIKTVDNRTDVTNPNLNIKLYKYQQENYKWMLKTEQTSYMYEYLDNHIMKIDNLYINLEKAIYNGLYV